MTGKIRRGQPAKPGTRAFDIAGTWPHFDEERLFDIVEALDDISKDLEKTIPQVALNWLLQQPTVSSIMIGARNEEQLVENIGSVGWQLSSEDLARLNRVSTVPVPYPIWQQRSFRCSTNVTHPGSFRKRKLGRELQSTLGDSR